MRKLFTAVTEPVTCLLFIDSRTTVQKPFIQHEWRRMIHLSAFDFDIILHHQVERKVYERIFPLTLNSKQAARPCQELE